MPRRRTGADSSPSRLLATEPARSRPGLCRRSSVVLLNTEGSDAVG